mmetsp:Transcript_6409/g.17472  ORF Transcript_6409/g.17472 Transcript_6409/m.17472 type:complete len:244 (+) Transcript_6409:238-969(+)
MMDGPSGPRQLHQECFVGFIFRCRKLVLLVFLLLLLRHESMGMNLHSGLLQHCFHEGQRDVLQEIRRVQLDYRLHLLLLLLFLLLLLLPQHHARTHHVNHFVCLAFGGDLCSQMRAIDVDHLTIGGCAHRSQQDNITIFQRRHDVACVDLLHVTGVIVAALSASLMLLLLLRTIIVVHLEAFRGVEVATNDIPIQWDRLAQSHVSCEALVQLTFQFETHKAGTFLQGPHGGIRDPWEFVIVRQ